MRILVCNWKDLAHPSAGGAEVYTHEITRRWAAQGHEVTLFAAAVDGRDSVERSEGVTIVREGSRHGVYGCAREFYGNDGGRFDIVIDEVNTRPFGCADWAGDSSVVAIIHQLAREVWFYETSLPVALAGRYWLERRWLRRYRGVPVLTLSESSRRSLREQGLRQVQVVPPGCDVAPRPEVVKEKRPTVVFVGRLAANKRPDHALRAFDLFHEAHPDSQMWVVGSGPMERSLVRKAGAGVTFFGHVSHAEKIDLLCRAHVVIATSVREGWGLVVDEAAACGTRAVAYDVPGLCDSVPAAGGFLVQPDPNALADELVRRLPSWAALPPAHGWRGGATSWDDVAGAVLQHAQAEVARNRASKAI